MEHQWYWKNWWKLWPRFSKDYYPDFDIFYCYFYIGPLQCRWMTLANSK